MYSFQVLFNVVIIYFISVLISDYLHISSLFDLAMTFLFNFI